MLIFVFLSFAIYWYNAVTLSREQPNARLAYFDFLVITDEMSLPYHTGKVCYRDRAASLMEETARYHLMCVCVCVTGWWA